jgi:hypothetical protein
VTDIKITRAYQRISQSDHHFFNSNLQVIAAKQEISDGGAIIVTKRLRMECNQSPNTA